MKLESSKSAVRIAGPAARQEGMGLPGKLILPIVLGTLLNALNSSMIAVALVSIQEGFAGSAGGAPRFDAMWLVSGLYLATTVSQPTMGRLAERFGARKIFFMGLIIVLLASVLAPFAPSLGWLIASRIALGIGTSAAYPAGMAMIQAWAQRHRDGAMPTGGLGAISVAGQVAVALGPPIGGVLVLVAGWRSIFWVNVPLVLTALTMAWLWLPVDTVTRGKSLSNTLRDLDLPGIGLFVATLSGLLLFLQSLSLQSNWPLLLGTLLSGGLLLLWERRAASPLIDIRMLQENPALMATYLRCTATYAVFYAIFYALPKWLEEARGLSSAEAGLMLLPVAGLGMVSTILATRLTHRSGPRLVLVIGSLMLCAGSVAMSQMAHGIPIWLILMISVVFGIPNGFNNLGNQATLYRSAPPNRLGTASGLYRTAQYVGGSVSFALVGMTLGHPASDGGLHRLAAVIAVIGILLLLNACSSKHIDPVEVFLPQQK